MAQKSTYSIKDNPDGPNIKNDFHRLRPSNASHTTNSERHDLTEHLILSTSLILTSRDKLPTPQRQSSEREVSLDSNKLPKMYVVAQNQPSFMNGTHQMPSYDEPKLGPRGGRKGKKVHACQYPDCGKIYTRQEHLGRHEKSHNNDNENFCEVCRQKLSRIDTYQKHLSTKKHRSNLQSQSPSPRESTANSAALSGTVPPSSTTLSFPFMSSGTSFPVPAHDIKQQTALNSHQPLLGQANIQQQGHAIAYDPPQARPRLTAHSSSAPFPPQHTRIWRPHSPSSTLQSTLTASTYNQPAESLPALIIHPGPSPAFSVKRRAAMSASSSAAFEIETRRRHSPSEAKQYNSMQLKSHNSILKVKRPGYNFE